MTVTAVKNEIGRQMWDLLERKPGHYDVLFSVGVSKVKVQAVKFILKAASSVFEREFEENWDTAVIKDGEGIPLVDVDPIAFQLFVKLLILDTWSFEVLKALDLGINILFALLRICHRFQITKAIKNLEAAADEWIRSFHVFKDTDEFLKMTHSNLATIISMEGLPLKEFDLFESVCRWAEFQCTQMEMEKSAENMRSILGPVLFKIRFPTMSTTEFSKVCRGQRNLLSDQEQLAVYNFIGMDANEKQKFDGNQLPFKTHVRKQLQPITKTQFDGSTLCLTKNAKLADYPAFICFNGNEKYDFFQISNGPIALHGIGFYGPIDDNSYLDVIVQIVKCTSVPRTSIVFGFERKEKRIFAGKRQIFHFIFDDPITIEPSDCASAWNCKEFYAIQYALKGPNTMAVEINETFEVPLEQTGGKFRFDCQSGRNQVAEILYKTI